MTNYDKLKQVIQKANPEIMLHDAGCSHCIKGTSHPFREIRLADVLLAIKGLNYLVDDFGQFWKFTKGGNPYYEVDYKDCKAEWNLKDDNLDHQSDETKQFLTNLLLPELISVSDESKDSESAP